jgi:nucleoid-associated protein YgaU
VRVSQKFIKFIETGAPVRARLNVTFHEFVDPEREAREVNRQTADFTKVHIVAYGDTISNIANQYYQDPAQWRPIAVANDIDDPRGLQPGRQLTSPSLPYTDPISGEVIS